MSLWQYTCVDTMKDSRDTCFPLSQRMSGADIQQGVNLCASLATTHITVDCFFDYADYFTTWVQAVRATGKKIWFRPRWNHWQGNNGAPADMTPAQYLSQTQSFITSNPLLFQAGDILDACSEPDQGAYWTATYGANWTNGAPTAGTNAFNQFILDLDSQLQTTLQSLGISGVITNIRSVTSFWAKTPSALYPSTVSKLGSICFDSYPEGSSTDPATCANARLAEIQQVANARPGLPIILGELGYSNAVTVTDDQQNAVLKAELAAIATVPNIIGMNYWVAQGTETSGGHTHLFSGTRGNWSLRPAALTLSTFYAQQLRGWVAANTIQATVAGVPVTMDSGTLQIQDAIGQRTTASFSVLDSTASKQFRQGQSVQVFVPPTGNQLTYNQSSVETDTSGFTAINGAVLTRDTTQFWQGAASLKVVTDALAANEGVAAYIPASQFVPGETITVSAWVLGTAGQTAEIFVHQQSPSIAIGTKTFFTFTGQWQRVTCTATLPATLQTTYYGIRIDNGQTAAMTFYVDGVQLEAASVASPWQGGIGATPPAVLFGGIIASSRRQRDGALNSTIRHTLSCVDWHYAADKRIAATNYANQTCGFIVSDLVSQYLAAEGVTIQRGVNLFTAQQSDVEGSDVSGFNPGTSVTVAQDTTPGNAFHGVGCLKFVSSGGANTFEQVEARVAAGLFTPGASVTISMYAKASVGTPTVRFYVQADTGAIGTATSITLSTTWTRYTKTVTLPNPITQVYIGLRLDTGSPAQAITVYMDAMQIEQAGAASAWELGGLKQSVQAGPTLTSYIVNYKPPATCFDELATLAGFYWYIDANKVLWFLAQTTTPAPFGFDGTQAEDGSIFVEDTSPLYRNGQYILGIKEVTASQTETRQGDGKTRAFTLSYPVHQVPSSITVNSVAKTIGISGVDTGKDYYWNKGSNIITQDNGAVILVSTDTLSVTYIGEFNVVVYSEDPTQVSVEATLEGGTTTGKVQQATADTTIVSAVQGYQKAAALLSKYAAAGKVLEFDTLTGGLLPGQLLNVNLPSGWDMAGVQALIESVTITADDYWFRYKVKALQGPVNDNWVQFFSRLVSQQGAIDTTASGVQQIVALLQPVNESWTWTESIVETVTACPVFPWTFPVTFC